jgi:hypothetical protein
LHNKYKKQTQESDQIKKKDKWVVLTYFGHETQKITKIFKDTNLEIAFRTNNTLLKHLQRKLITMRKAASIQ